MSLKKNLMYNIVLTISNMIFPIISFPYAARILGPNGTGEVSFAQSFCQYFIIAAALGIPTYGVREIAKMKTDKLKMSNLFLEINLIRIATTALALLPYFIVVFTVDKFNSNVPLYAWGALFIVLNVTSIEWFFIGLEDFKYITVRSLIVKIISIALLFVMVKSRTDIIPYFLINVLGVLFNGYFNFRHARKYIDYTTLKIRQLNLKQHLRPLMLIFSGVIAITVYTLMDTFLLGIMVSNSSVGFYTAATKITKISLTIITSLSAVLIPRFSYAVSNGNKQELERLTAQSFNFVYSFGIPMVIGIFVLAPELIYIFSGNEFFPAVITLRIMCPLIFIIGLASIFSSQVLSSMSKDKLVMNAAVIGAVISVVANLILIPIYKENGSAISNVLAELVVTITVYFYAKRFLTLKLAFKTILLNSALCLPFFLIAALFRQYISNPLLLTSLILSVCCIYYLGVQLIVLKNTMLNDLYQKGKAILKIR